MAAFSFWRAISFRLCWIHNSAMRSSELTQLIAAIATAPGRGGVGVVRVSGVGAQQVAQGVIGKIPAQRQATLATFRDAKGLAIDSGLALFFKGPHSYTGEDVLELQGHGGPVVLGLLLARCIELGCRLAEPGEFTRRAYLNDKIDLAQAESVADLIEAASAQAARAAVRSLEGAFSRQVHQLRDDLVTLRMLVEATLDFPEEELDFLKREHAWERLESLRTALGAILQRATQGARLRAGLNVVLVGRPNVGKSSLLNALAGEEVAIVTAIPGTTRDRIERAITIEGMPLNLIDTAGLRDSEDIVEQAGMQRTRDAAGKADLVLRMVVAGEEADDTHVDSALLPGVPHLTVVNKIDATGESPGVEGECVRISAKTGAGLDALRAELVRRAGLEGAGEDVILARTRHLDALREALGRVEAAVAHLQPDCLALELFAEELRLAQEALNRITGEFSADDLLGEIFGRFCIGK